jgi:hypothetical protein
MKIQLKQIKKKKRQNKISQLKNHLNRKIIENGKSKFI